MVIKSSCNDGVKVFFVDVDLVHVLHIVIDSSGECFISGGDTLVMVVGSINEQRFIATNWRQVREPGDSGDGTIVIHY